MKVHLYDSVEVLDPKNLPDDKALEIMIRKLGEIGARTARGAHSRTLCRAGYHSQIAQLGYSFTKFWGIEWKGIVKKTRKRVALLLKKVGRKKLCLTLLAYTMTHAMHDLNGKTLAGYYHYDNEGIESAKGFSSR